MAPAKSHRPAGLRADGRPGTHAGLCPLCSDVGRRPSNGGGPGRGIGVSGPGGGGPGTVGLVAVYGRVYCWHHDRTARLLLLHRFYKCGPAAGPSAATLLPLRLQLHISGVPWTTGNGSHLEGCTARCMPTTDGNPEVCKMISAGWPSGLQTVHTTSNKNARQPH